jgi:hypothetical protein
MSTTRGLRLWLMTSCGHANRRRVVRRHLDAEVVAQVADRRAVVQRHRLAGFEPLRNEIEARCAAHGTSLAEATAVAATAVAERLGDGAVDAKIQARVVRVTA